MVAPVDVAPVVVAPVVVVAVDVGAVVVAPDDVPGVVSVDVDELLVADGVVSVSVLSVIGDTSPNAPDTRSPNANRDTSPTVTLMCSLLSMRLATQSTCFSGFLPKWRWQAPERARGMARQPRTAHCWLEWSGIWT